MYNGYTNYETWNVALWLNNEYGDYQYWTARVNELKEERNNPDFSHRYWTAKEYAKFTLADEIKEYVEDGNPLADNASMFSDLLGAALSSVDWNEVAEGFLED